MAQVQTDLVGTVRRYNGSRGYGFIVGPGQFQDTMFSRHELPADAKEIRGNVLEERQVLFDAQIMPDGRAKAVGVKIPYAEGVKLPGIIKNFFDNKGYGFVQSSSVPEDVFFKRDDFSGSAGNVTGDIKGQLVLFEVGKSPDGKLRAQNMQFQTMKIAEKFRSGTGGGGIDDATMSSMIQQLSSGGMNPHNMQNIIQQMMGAINGGSSFSGSGPQQLSLPSSQTGVAPSGGLTLGRVKTFSEVNGYGFISAPGLGGDVKFGREHLPPHSSIEKGTEVEFSATQTPDGRLQADCVYIAGTGGGGSKRPASLMDSWGEGSNSPAVKLHRATDVPVQPTGQTMHGTVKSYNPVKGWGLIACPNVQAGGNGLPGDVFFMKSNLPAESRQGQCTGQAVTFELVMTEDGKHRAQSITFA